MKTYKSDKRKKVKTIEINKDFCNFEDALLDLGYKTLEDMNVLSSQGEKIKTLYKKDGRIYEFAGAENFNTYIYNIRIREVEEISEI